MTHHLPDLGLQINSPEDCLLILQRPEGDGAPFSSEMATELLLEILQQVQERDSCSRAVYERQNADHDGSEGDEEASSTRMSNDQWMVCLRKLLQLMQSAPEQLQELAGLVHTELMLRPALGTALMRCLQATLPAPVHTTHTDQDLPGSRAPAHQLHGTRLFDGSTGALTYPLPDCAQHSTAWEGQQMDNQPASLTALLKAGIPAAPADLLLVAAVTSSGPATHSVPGASASGEGVHVAMAWQSLVAVCITCSATTLQALIHTTMELLPGLGPWLRTAGMQLLARASAAASAWGAEQPFLDLAPMPTTHQRFSSILAYSGDEAGMQQVLDRCALLRTPIPQPSSTAVQTPVTVACSPQPALNPSSTPGTTLRSALKKQQSAGSTWWPAGVGSWAEAAMKLCVVLSLGGEPVVGCGSSIQELSKGVVARTLDEVVAGGVPEERSVHWAALAVVLQQAHLAAALRHHLLQQSAPPAQPSQCSDPGLSPQTLSCMLEDPNCQQLLGTMWETLDTLVDVIAEHIPFLMAVAPVPVAQRLTTLLTPLLPLVAPSLRAALMRAAADSAKAAQAAHRAAASTAPPQPACTTMRPPPPRRPAHARIQHQQHATPCAPHSAREVHTLPVDPRPRPSSVGCHTPRPTVGHRDPPLSAPGTPAASGTPRPPGGLVATPSSSCMTGSTMACPPSMCDSLFSHGDADHDDLFTPTSHLSHGSPRSLVPLVSPGHAATPLEVADQHTAAVAGWQLAVHLFCTVLLSAPDTAHAQCGLCDQDSTDSGLSADAETVLNALLSTGRQADSSWQRCAATAQHLASAVVQHATRQASQPGSAAMDQQLMQLLQQHLIQLLGHLLLPSPSAATARSVTWQSATTSHMLTALQSHTAAHNPFTQHNCPSRTGTGSGDTHAAQCLTPLLLLLGHTAVMQPAVTQELSELLGGFTRAAIDDESVGGATRDDARAVATLQLQQHLLSISLQLLVEHPQLARPIVSQAVQTMAETGTGVGGAAPSTVTALAVVLAAHARATQALHAKQHTTSAAHTEAVLTAPASHQPPPVRPAADPPPADLQFFVRRTAVDTASAPQPAHRHTIVASGAELQLPPLQQWTLPLSQTVQLVTLLSRDDHATLCSTHSMPPLHELLAYVLAWARRAMHQQQDQAPNPGSGRSDAQALAEACLLVIREASSTLTLPASTVAQAAKGSGTTSTPPLPSLPTLLSLSQEGRQDQSMPAMVTLGTAMSLLSQQVPALTRHDCLEPGGRRRSGAGDHLRASAVADGLVPRAWREHSGRAVCMMLRGGSSRQAWNEVARAACQHPCLGAAVALLLQVYASLPLLEEHQPRSARRSRARSDSKEAAQQPNAARQAVHALVPGYLALAASLTEAACVTPDHGSDAAHEHGTVRQRLDLGDASRGCTAPPGDEQQGRPSALHGDTAAVEAAVGVPEAPVPPGPGQPDTVHGRRSSSTTLGWFCVVLARHLLTGAHSLPDLLGPTPDVLSPLLRICCSTTLPTEGYAHTDSSPQTLYLGAQHLVCDPTRGRVPAAQPQHASTDADDAEDEEGVLWCSRMVAQLLRGMQRAPQHKTAHHQVPMVQLQLLCPLLLMRKLCGERPVQRPTVPEHATHAAGVSLTANHASECSRGVSLRRRKPAVDYNMASLIRSTRKPAAGVSKVQAASVPVAQVLGYAAWAQRPGAVLPPVAANTVTRLLGYLWRQIRGHVHSFRELQDAHPFVIHDPVQQDPDGSARQPASPSTPATVPLLLSGAAHPDLLHPEALLIGLTAALNAATWLASLARATSQDTSTTDAAQAQLDSAELPLQDHHTFPTAVTPVRARVWQQTLLGLHHVLSACSLAAGELALFLDRMAAPTSGVTGDMPAPATRSASLPGSPQRAARAGHSTRLSGPTSVAPHLPGDQQLARACSIVALGMTAATVVEQVVLDVTALGSTASIAAAPAGTGTPALTPGAWDSTRVPPSSPATPAVSVRGLVRQARVLARTQAKFTAQCDALLTAATAPAAPAVQPTDSNAPQTLHAGLQQRIQTVLAAAVQRASVQTPGGLAAAGAKGAGVHASVACLLVARDPGTCENTAAGAAVVGAAGVHVEEMATVVEHGAAVPDAGPQRAAAVAWVPKRPFSALPHDIPGDPLDLGADLFMNLGPATLAEDTANSETDAESYGGPTSEEDEQPPRPALSSQQTGAASGSALQLSPSGLRGNAATTSSGRVAQQQSPVKAAAKPAGRPEARSAAPSSVSKRTGALPATTTAAVSRQPAHTADIQDIPQQHGHSVRVQAPASGRHRAPLTENTGTVSATSVQAVQDPGVCTAHGGQSHSHGLTSTSRAVGKASKHASVHLSRPSGMGQPQVSLASVGACSGSSRSVPGYGSGHVALSVLGASSEQGVGADTVRDSGRGSGCMPGASSSPAETRVHLSMSSAERPYAGSMGLALNSRTTSVAVAAALAGRRAAAAAVPQAPPPSGICSPRRICSTPLNQHPTADSTHRRASTSQHDTVPDPSLLPSPGRPAPQAPRSEAAGTAAEMQPTLQPATTGTDVSRQRTHQQAQGVQQRSSAPTVSPNQAAEPHRQLRQRSHNRGAAEPLAQGAAWFQLSFVAPIKQSSVQATLKDAPMPGRAHQTQGAAAQNSAAALETDRAFKQPRRRWQTVTKPPAASRGDVDVCPAATEELPTCTTSSNGLRQAASRRRKQVLALSAGPSPEQSNAPAAPQPQHKSAADRSRRQQPQDLVGNDGVDHGGGTAPAGLQTTRKAGRGKRAGAPQQEDALTVRRSDGALAAGAPLSMNAYVNACLTERDGGQGRARKRRRAGRAKGSQAALRTGGLVKDDGGAGGGSSSSESSQRGWSDLEDFIVCQPGRDYKSLVTSRFKDCGGTSSECTSSGED